MPMTYRACVAVVYMFDMRHTTVTCYTVSRDRARCHSTVHLNLKKIDQKLGVSLQQLRKGKATNLNFLHVIY